MPYKLVEDKKARAREYHKKWYAKPENSAKQKAKAKKLREGKREINRQFLRDYKSSHPCEDCGENHVCCLDFHHRDPLLKEHNLANMAHAYYSLKRIQAEIEKCRVLCRNCHAKEHDRLRNTVP